MAYERIRGSKRLATALGGLGMGKIYELSKMLNYQPMQLIEDIDAIYRVVYNDPDPKKDRNKEQSLLEEEANDLLF